MKTCCGITYADKETVCKFCGKPLVSNSPQPGVSKPAGNGGTLDINDFMSQDEDDAEAGTSVLTSGMMNPMEDDSEAGTSVLTADMMGMDGAEAGTTVLTGGMMRDDAEAGTTVLSANILNGQSNNGNLRGSAVDPNAPNPNMNGYVQTKPQEGKGGLPPAAIAGIIVGAVLVVTAVIIIVLRLTGVIG